jgi:hypothetical protein
MLITTGAAVAQTRNDSVHFATRNLRDGGDAMQKASKVVYAAPSSKGHVQAASAECHVQATPHAPAIA